MPNSLDVLIACFNEEETIENVVLEHLRVLEESAVFKEFKITILNDGSYDKSGSILRSLSLQHANIICITNPNPSGIHAAFNQLVSSTNLEWVYFTSGDGQYPSKILKDLISNFNQNADIFIAKRINKPEVYTVFRLTVSAFYRLSVLIMSGYDPIDAGSTKLIRRKLLLGNFSCKYLAKDAEIVVKAKKENREIKIVRSNFGIRTSGKSNIGLKVIIKTFIDTLNLIKYRF
jgi:dolichol-phosphate mannosyltransferase